MEMQTASTTNLEDNTIRMIYEASLNGCVTTLTTLIQNNPLILYKLSLSPFNETPLHIASLLGHIKFCEILLKRKPGFANEVDSKGRCPLHLASAEGHTEVVRALLLANQDTCFALDKDDNLPLHLAVMRGRVGTIKELINAKPDSIQVTNDDGSVLHLCIRYNHFEALKLLLQSVLVDQQFLLAKDKEGYTILQLAVRLKQIKTIKFLLMLPEIRSTTATVSNMLEHCPRDFLSLKIEEMLVEAGVLRPAIAYMDIAQPSPSMTSQEQPNRRKMWEKFWLKYLEFQGDWIGETRGTLMVVATVIATMTFQSTISPPGGVWQEDTRTGGRNCTTYGICEAGTAVLAYAWPSYYVNFMTYSTISFVSSLGVVLLLISGFPLRNKVMMWILTIAMTMAITFMVLTYIYALGLVTPYHIIDTVYRMIHPLAVTWGIMLLVVGLIHTLRLVFMVKKRPKKKVQTAEFESRVRGNLELRSDSPSANLSYQAE